MDQLIVIVPRDLIVYTIGRVHIAQFRDAVAPTRTLPSRPSDWQRILRRASAEGKMKPAMRTVILYLLPVLLTVSGVVATSSKGESSRFLAVAPGIEHATFLVQSEDAVSFSGHAFKIDLNVAAVRLVPAGGPSSRRTVEEIVARYPAVIAINASFFDKEGGAMGLAVDAGRLLASGKRRSWGALVVDGENARIMLGADIQDHLAHRLIVQGIPRLVVGGKVQQLKPQVAERTAVCAKGNVVVLVVSTKADASAFARWRVIFEVVQGNLAGYKAALARAATSSKTVLQFSDHFEKLNKEIGAGAEGGSGVTIIRLITNVDPEKLRRKPS